MENAGLSEIFENVLYAMSMEQKNKILKNVFIIGGNAKVLGFDNRIRAELRMLVPTETPISVVRAYD
jgi:actin-related protein 5